MRSRRARRGLARRRLPGHGGARTEARLVQRVAPRQCEARRTCCRPAGGVDRGVRVRDGTSRARSRRRRARLPRSAMAMSCRRATARARSGGDRLPGPPGASRAARRSPSSRPGATTARAGCRSSPCPWTGRATSPRCGRTCRGSSSALPGGDRRRPVDPAALSSHADADRVPGGARRLGRGDAYGLPARRHDARGAHRSPAAGRFGFRAGPILSDGYPEHPGDSAR